MQDQSADWPHGDRDGLTGGGQSEREAAIEAARKILAGPTVAVERAQLLQLMALLRETTRVVERVLDEAGAGGKPAGDDQMP